VVKPGAFLLVNTIEFFIRVCCRNRNPGRS